eukprot:gene394-395_t
MTTTRRQFVQALGASAALGAFHPFAAHAQVDQVKVLAIVGLMPHGSTPEEQARWQKAEYDSWGPLIKKIGFTAES